MWPPQQQIVADLVGGGSFTPSSSFLQELAKLGCLLAEWLDGRFDIRLADRSVMWLVGQLSK